MARCYDYATCFQEAPAGSLWCDHCRAERARLHETRSAAKTAVIQASVAARNAEDQARTEVECEGGCGKLVPDARRRQLRDVEALRRRIQRGLMTGKVTIDSGRPILDSKQAYMRSIELTNPHRLQQAQNLCDACLQERSEDFKVFLSDGP